MNESPNRNVTESLNASTEGRWNDPSSPGQEPSLDTVLNVLADAYRRRLLVALLEHDSQDVDDARIPADVTSSDEEWDRLDVELIHVHLPKLERAGLVEWDRETRELRTGSHFEAVRPLLRFVRDNADELPDERPSSGTTA
ncbi:DUF7344 domain-containing protein [Halomicrococcus sp. NG-SE-24]|uniref:DUF7344 domain-containing protein n=1 Tax=Halomicrococcus sp. NG-SE-24 TaxID=3436928 RepID=UPI003D97F8FC